MTWGLGKRGGSLHRAWYGTISLALRPAPPNVQNVVRVLFKLLEVGGGGEFYFFSGVGIE